MKEITIISGKGGTGKTTIASSFGILAEKVVLADCDVDAANLGILLHHETHRTEPYFGIRKASLNSEKCTKCGMCADVCYFKAIQFTSEKYPIFDRLSCEGCGACAYVCPEEAIDLRQTETGVVYESEFDNKTLIHARLTPGEGVSGKLVTRVRQLAKEHAIKKGAHLIISDGSPGIGCPVIASLTGADFALIVTEPTLSGLHDLKRVKSLCDHLKVPTAVTINKYDLHEDMANQIANYCKKNQIPLLPFVPFDSEMTKAMAQTQSILDYSPDSPSSKAIHRLWEKIKEIIR